MNRVDDHSCRDLGMHLKATRHTESECGINQPPRFLVFAHMEYDAAGGWGDHKGSFTDLGEAAEFERRLRLKERYDYTEVVDLVTGKVVG